MREGRPVGRAISVATLLVAAAGALRGENGAAAWRIDAAKSTLVIHVTPGGMLASALHEHHFQPERWSGEIARDPEKPGVVKVSVRVAADSLRDHQPKLSANDVAKVEAQTRGGEILDAARYPEIRFESAELRDAELPSGDAGEFRGTLSGALTLHGTTRPLAIPVHGRVSADKIEANGTAKFRQSEFGIKPYSTALGTIAVKDEVAIEITLVAERKP